MMIISRREYEQMTIELNTLRATNAEMVRQMYADNTEKDLRKWIPVSERLPNHDEYIKNNGLFNVSDGNRSYTEWFDIYDKQGFGEPTMAGFRVDYAVIAWQPLPEPYKEGDADMRKPNCVTCDHFGKCEGCERSGEE